jgi:hypothetical protein
VTFSKPGKYRLRVVVSDGLAYSRGDVLVTAGAPSTPVAQPDRFAAVAGMPLTVAAPGLLANDSDTAAKPSEMEAVLAQPPTHGKVVVTQDGSFRYFAPKAFVGADRFAYKAVNLFGMESAAAEVIVDVKAATPETAVEPSAGACGCARIAAWNSPTTECRHGETSPATASMRRAAAPKARPRSLRTPRTSVCPPSASMGRMTCCRRQRDWSC